MSCVLRHVSCVTNNNKNNNKKSLIKIGKRGGSSRGRVCYQRGLPRLVLKMGKATSLYKMYSPIQRLVVALYEVDFHSKVLQCFFIAGMHTSPSQKF